MARNACFAATFELGDMPILPQLRTLIVTCIDARVDPAHILGLDLGEAIVARNNGGRVTRAVIEEILTLTVLVGAATGGQETAFNIVLLQHTNCGAQRLADPQLQGMLQQKFGIDVSEYAVTDQAADLMTDIGRLADAPGMPGEMTVSAMVYDVATGAVQEVAPVKSLAEYRAANVGAAVPMAE
ncbi:carbonic anhydrase [Roseivivax lentus]|nr:carbonic anhydrase [Roseivivax lentus]